MRRELFTIVIERDNGYVLGSYHVVDVVQTGWISRLILYVKSLLPAKDERLKPYKCGLSLGVKMTPGDYAKLTGLIKTPKADGHATMDLIPIPGPEGVASEDAVV